MQSNRHFFLCSLIGISVTTAQRCELVGLFILNSLAEKYGKDYVGLYRDDGLILLKGTSKRLADKARKDLHKLLAENFQLKITAEICHQTVNFLDLTFNLHEQSYKPYRKPNNDPLFINSHSNHPPSIIKQIPLSVNKRISQLSSDQNAFSAAAPMYEGALNHSNYHVNLHYTPSNNSNGNKRRQRNIIWFNPPYSKNVRTNVGKIFLNLIDKHFPPSNCLHKIFNRNSVKVSYSCMDNCKSIISKHNTRMLSTPKSTTQTSSSTNSATCNCNNSNECPLQKKCLLDCIVYKAEVVTNNSEPKEYIGMTGNTFKKRLYNHNKSFKNDIYRNNTELSKYVWNLKEKQQVSTINWSILKRAASYSSGGKRCNLCLQEKLCILKADKSNLLNRRRELFSKCVHQKRFLAGKFERAQAQSRTQTQSRKQYNGYQRHQAGKVS